MCIRDSLLDRINTVYFELQSLKCLVKCSNNIPRTRELISSLCSISKRSMPVSYTHLDVYKRQQFNGAILNFTFIPAVIVFWNNKRHF